MNGTPKRGRASVCSVYFPAGGLRRLEDTAYLESRGLRTSHSSTSRGGSGSRAMGLA